MRPSHHNPPPTLCDRLPWPEPLMIELVGERLARQPLTTLARQTLARQHAAVMEAVVVNRDPSWRAARTALRQCYAALSIGPGCVAAIDNAIFSELTRLVAERFRTSPRRREEARALLRAAIARLPLVANAVDASRAAA